MCDELKKNNNGYNNIIFYIMIFKIDTMNRYYIFNSTEKHYF